MKKWFFMAAAIALLCFAGAAMADGIAVDTEHFPDDAFRAYVAETIDEDGDGILSDAEQSAVTEINVSSKGISSMRGMEYFPNLATLDLQFNTLSGLDISKNTALTWLACGYSQLTSLDVSGNMALSFLSCNGNSLTSLDVSRNTALTELHCDNNKLSSLDVSRNAKLHKLTCEINSLSSLNVSSNTQLSVLYCGYNRLTSLNVKNNPSLDHFACEQNQLTSLDLTNNTALQSAECNDNCRSVTAENGRFDLGNLPGFDVSRASGWVNGAVSGNTLVVSESGSVTYVYDLGNGQSETFTLEVTVTGSVPAEIPVDSEHFPDAVFRAYVQENFDKNGNGKLSEAEILGVTGIEVWDKGIASLQGIEFFSYLTDLACFNNRLTNLNVSRNTALETLDCSNNQLTSLNVSGNTALYALTCDHNNLTSLDVSGHAALTDLDCGYNNLSSLNVRNCFHLANLSCPNNNLSSIDLSGCQRYASYDFSNNHFTNLSLDGWEMYVFSCSGNTRSITAENGQFDLTSFPGFDVSKASNWHGGKVVGSTLYVAQSGTVTYEYDFGGVMTVGGGGGSWQDEISLNVTVNGTVPPLLGSVQFGSAGVSAKKEIAIMAVTSVFADKLVMYAENGAVAKTWTEGYTENGGTRTWKVSYAFSGAGDRSMGFKAFDESGKASDMLKANVKVTAAPTLSSVKFNSAIVQLKKDAAITAVTSTGVTKLVMYNGSSAVKSWTSGYTDSGTTRTWKVSYAFSGAGNRTMTFKGADAWGTLTAAKTASVTVTAGPILSSVKFSSASVQAKKNVTITAVTSTDAAKLNMYAGSSLIKSWTSGYTDSGSTRTWKVTYAFNGTGNRTMTFKGVNAGGTASAGKTASITVTAAPAAPTLSSVKFDSAGVQVKQNVGITAVTNTAVTKLSMYNGSSLIKSWTSGYTDSGSTRTWKVSYAFSGTGSRTMTFKGVNAGGTATAARTATVAVTAGPTLNSVKFTAASASVGQSVTITAVTNTAVTKLNMYSGSSLIRSWTSGYTDSGSMRTWKVSYAFSGAGSRTMTFKGEDANKAATGAQKAAITVTALQSLTLSSVQFDAARTMVDRNVVIRAVTSKDVTKLNMYNGSSLIKSWTSGYTDSGNTRTWKVSYAFSGAGNRTMTFKGANAQGKLTAAKNAGIQVTPRPQLSSVKFPADTVKRDQSVTITAVTSQNVTRLDMYSGANWVAGWSSGYTDSGSTRTWKVKYTFGTAGKFSMLFQGSDADNNLTGSKTLNITVTAPAALKSAKFNVSTEKVKQNVTITVVTSNSVTKLIMYAENGATAKTWTSGYTDSNGVRTWKVSYAFGAAGNRTMTFYGLDAEGNAAGPVKATITITK